MLADSFASLACVYCFTLRCSLDANFTAIFAAKLLLDACLHAVHRGRACSNASAWTSSFVLGVSRTGFVRESCAQDRSVLISQCWKINPEPFH